MVCLEHIQHRSDSTNGREEAVIVSKEGFAVFNVVYWQDRMSTLQCVVSMNRSFARICFILKVYSRWITYKDLHFKSHELPKVCIALFASICSLQIIYFLVDINRKFAKSMRTFCRWHRCLVCLCTFHLLFSEDKLENKCFCYRWFSYHTQMHWKGTTK